MTKQKTVSPRPRLHGKVRRVKRGIPRTVQGGGMMEIVLDMRFDDKLFKYAGLTIDTPCDFQDFKKSIDRIGNLLSSHFQSTHPELFKTELAKEQETHNKGTRK